MVFNTNLVRIILFISICLFSEILFANEKIIFESDSLAQEVLMGAKWKCNDSALGNQNATGHTIFQIEEATKKKIKGKYWKKDCQGEPGKIFGKIKNDTVKYKIKSLPKNCWSGVKGSLEFYKDKNGSYVSDGFYKGRRGTSEMYDGRLVCKKE